MSIFEPIISRLKNVDNPLYPIYIHELQIDNKDNTETGDVNSLKLCYKSVTFKVYKDKL